MGSSGSRPKRCAAVSDASAKAVHESPPPCGCATCCSWPGRSKYDGRVEHRLPPVDAAPEASPPDADDRADGSCGAPSSHCGSGPPPVPQLSTDLEAVRAVRRARSGHERLLTISFALCALALGGATAAAADGSWGPWEPTFQGPISVPAGAVCPFAVSAEPVRVDLAVRYHYDETGAIDATSSRARSSPGSRTSTRGRASSAASPASAASCRMPTVPTTPSSRAGPALHGERRQPVERAPAPDRLHRPARIADGSEDGSRFERGEDLCQTLA